MKNAVMTKRHRSADKLYVLSVDNIVICISEYLEDIDIYIEQFKAYFLNHSEYEIKEYSNNRGIYADVMAEHRQKYLYEWKDGVVLTDLEVMYITSFLREMYEQQKIMVSQSVLNSRLMLLSEFEKNIILKTGDMMYKKLETFEEFVKNVNAEFVLKNYIVNPMSTDHYEYHYSKYMDRLWKSGENILELNG